MQLLLLLRVSVRPAASGALIVGVLAAVVSSAVGLLALNALAALEFAAIGAVTGALWLGPTLGAAVSAAHAREAGGVALGRTAFLHALERGAAVGTFWGAAGGIGLWLLNEAVSGIAVGPISIAFVGGLLGFVIGAACGVAVAATSRHVSIDPGP